MGNFITNLSFNLLGKEVLKSVNIWQVTGKWLIVSYALHFCPQRCTTRQINKILQTKTVTNFCCVNRQLNAVYHQQISKCCRPVLTYWLTDWHYQWLTDCWSCTAVCCDIFFFVAVAAAVYSRSLDFFYIASYLHEYRVQCFVLYFWLTVYVQTQMSTLSRRHTTYVSNNARSYHRWTRATRCLTHVVLYTDVLFELSWQHIATIDDVPWRNSVSLEFGTKFQRKVVP